MEKSNALSFNRLIKIAFIAYFVAMAIVLLQVRDSAATGFERSIYGNTPLSFWLFLGITFAIGIGIIIHQVLTNSRGRLWLAGFGLLILGKFLFLSLHAFRGYFNFVANDPNAHLGYIKDIVDKGRISPYLFYPLTHIFNSEFVLLANIVPNTIVRYTPAYLSLAMSIFLVLLATQLFSDRRSVMLTAVATIPLFFLNYHIMPYPRGFAVFLFPLATYLFFKSRNSPTPAIKACLLFSIASFVAFAHPFIAVELIMFLAIFEPSLFLYRTLHGKVRRGQPATELSTSGLLPQKQPNMQLMIFTSIVFFIWVVNFAIWPSYVRQIRSTLVGELAAGNEWLQKAESLAQLPPVDKVIFFFKLYGSPLIFMAIFAVAALIILYRIIRRQQGYDNWLGFIAWVAVASLVVLGFFLGLGGSAPVENSPVSQVSVLFAAWLFSQWLLQRSAARRLLFTSLAVFLVVFAGFLGMAAIYRSPYIYQTSNQMTYTDATSTAWTYSYKPTWLRYNVIAYPYSAPHFTLGTDATDFTRMDTRQNLTTLSLSIYNVREIPPRFGYDKFSTMGEQFVTDRYVVLTQRFYDVYADPLLSRKRAYMHATFGRWDFKIEDFERWKQDPTVDTIYTSDAVSIYLVTGTLIRPTPPGGGGRPL